VTARVRSDRTGLAHAVADRQRGLRAEALVGFGIAGRIGEAKDREPVIAEGRRLPGKLPKLQLIFVGDGRTADREVDCHLFADAIPAVDDRLAKLGELLGRARLGRDRRAPIALLELDPVGGHRFAC
jgi:hypothetical protein